MASSLVHPRLFGRLMHFFPHTVQVRRATTSTDAYKATKETFEPLPDRVRGRYIEETKRNPLSELAEDPLITSIRLLVPGALDIQETDQIGDVREVNDDGSPGALVEAGPLKIIAVHQRRVRGTVFLALEMERQ